MAWPSKIGKKDFVKALRKNCGNYAKTAHYITDELGIPVSRQAVRQRAITMPDIQKDIAEGILDKAEGTIVKLMDKADRDSTSLQAAKFYLEQKGAKRGYTKDPSVVVNNEKGKIQADNITLENVDPDVLLKLK